MSFADVEIGAEDRWNMGGRRSHEEGAFREAKKPEKLWSISWKSTEVRKQK
jgi:hypothetical protein